ncbi:uncharacterized protein PFL1_05567 [Pseudozyma flocculosa PF-1]|uniref:Autophagy-related protein 101 n=2 Tax=Pseudozyma flocculosa TaxID=84751 RepID=A0A5C3FCS9_9BASI|nr:uncharacterized protein PFL1_05567 [Pseudozyma flocculosa PF-1]EPQ26933.1 hypothetical protein PFL1_05567 [Pseudozyma flocculosa PF-1]SPO41159.1 uncharacterized protein PSFLO_06641 [Pseudozyma flocculosa]
MTTPPAATSGGGSGSSGVGPLETFQFELTVEPRNLRDVVRTVLHSICFHRVFGTVRPKTIDLFGMTFPAVHEAEIERMVEDQTAAFCRQVEAKACKRVDLFVYLLHPATAGQRQPTSTAGQSTAADPADQQRQEAHASSSSSPVSAASKSLKSWATSKTMSGYPYTWLAHAFSGGSGQAAEAGAETARADGDGYATAKHQHQQQDAAEREKMRLERQSFETWRIRFEVVSARSERERLRLQSTTAGQMAEFLDSLLVFVDEKKAHIPAIISADLCPFPIEIQSVAIA